MEASTEPRKPRVLNLKDLQEGDKGVYIGRPSIWGNPFTIGKDGTREQVIKWHAAWMMQQPELIALAKEQLKGQDLLCFCAPEACHGDLLLRIANED